MSDPKVIRYRTDEGVFTGLQILEGHKFIHLILMDSAGIRIRKVPVAEGRFIKVLDYPLQRAALVFRKAGGNFGITDGAKQALRDIRRHTGQNAHRTVTPVTV